MKKPQVVKVDPGDPPIERSVLASSIVELSKAAKKLLSGPLNERAIVLLLHDSSGVGKPDVRAVLTSLWTLERDYVKPQDKHRKEPA